MGWTKNEQQTSRTKLASNFFRSIKPNFGKLHIWSHNRGNNCETGCFAIPAPPSIIRNQIQPRLTPEKKTSYNTHTHTRLVALCSELPGWAGTRKVKPIWILLILLSGSSNSWAICKSTPRSRQIAMPAPYHSRLYRLDALPAAQPTASKHWRPAIYTKTESTGSSNSGSSYPLGSAIFSGCR